jgi:catechol-2,3-dioxygenase
MSTLENRPPPRGIHDLKFAVSDLDESLRSYEHALGAKHVPELDHTRDDGTRFAAVIEVPGLGTVLQLRLDPERAGRQAIFDPSAIAMDDRASLGQWDATVTELGVLHSPILEAVSGWLIVIQDPDGNRIRLYTLESHGPEGQAGHQQPVVGRVKAGSTHER